MLILSLNYPLKVDKPYDDHLLKTKEDKRKLQVYFFHKKNVQSKLDRILQEESKGAIKNFVRKLVSKKVPDNLLFKSNGACEYFFYYVLSNKKERNLYSFDIFYYFPHLIISIFLVHHPWFKIRLIAHLAILGFFSTSKINS